jgi:hypothetical protein
VPARRATRRSEPQPAITVSAAQIFTPHGVPRTPTTGG